MNATKIIELLDEKLTYNEQMDLLDGILIEWLSVSIDTLNLIQGINGRNEDTFNDVLYYTTGLRDLEQLLDDMAELKEYIINIVDLYSE